MAGVKFLADLITKDALQFQTSGGSNAGKIEMDGDNLVLSNAVGDILFGDTDSNIYIGDGVNSVDILFEQSGSIRSEVGSNATLTLGSSGTTLNLYNPQVGNGMVLTSTMAINTGGSIDYTPDTGVFLKFDGQTILERRTAGGALTFGHDDAVIIAGGDTSAVLNANERGVIQGVVIRLSNTYGAPMHKDVNCWMLVVNDLCRQAAQTRRLVLQTSGLQQRDFVCMTEVCRVAEALIIADGGSIKTSIFNVGSGVSQSILEIATLIQQRCSIVLGFEPFLDFKKAYADEEQPRLSYMSDHLASLVISVKSMDKVIEIDELLQFCQRSFPKEESINI